MSKLKICEECGKTYTNKRKHHSEFHKKGPHKWTDDEKKRISESRKLFLKNNKDKHPWKYHSKFKSVPCEHLKQKLKNKNYKFFEEQGIKELNKNYSVDILFPQLKFIIEVNGNQHYDRKGNLFPYYQQRHNEIENCGYKILELPYIYCYDDLFFQKLCNLLDGMLCSKNDINFSEYVPYKPNDNSKKHQRNLHREKLIKEGRVSKNGKVSERFHNEDDWIKWKEQILTSGIDLTKYGWVGKVVEKTKLTKRQVRETARKFNLNVFSRKN